MSKPKTMFICQKCGYQSPKWLGRCPDCEEYSRSVERNGVEPRDCRRCQRKQPTQGNTCQHDAEQ